VSPPKAAVWVPEEPLPIINVIQVKPDTPPPKRLQKPKRLRRSKKLRKGFEYVDNIETECLHPEHYLFS
jgi:hypothetical protein